MPMQKNDLNCQKFSILKDKCRKKTAKKSFLLKTPI